QWVQLKLTFDRRAPRRFQLRLKKLQGSANHLVYLHQLELRLRHFGKFAELADNSFQIRNLRQQRPRTLPEHFLELLRTLLPRPHQILHRELQGKKRIFQLVRQPPRQLPPCRHPLRLHQAFLLSQQLGGHAIERFGKLSQFVCARHLHARIPIATRDLLRGMRQLLHRTRHSRRRPTAEKNRQYDPAAAHQQSRRPDVPLQLHISSPRVANQQNCEEWRILSRACPHQRDRMKHLVVGLIPRPLHHCRHLLLILPHSIDHGLQLFRSTQGVAPIGSRRGVDQQLTQKMIPAVLIKQRPHPSRQIQLGEEFLVQPPPPNHINRTLSHPRRPYRKQS